MTATPPSPVIDDYHGLRIPDPYRHLENLDLPEVRAWLDREAAATRATLEGLPGRAALLARIRELDAGLPAVVTDVARLADETLIYLKRAATADVAVLCRRDAATGVEQVLVDPATFPRQAAADHVALEFFVPSPDGRYVLYGFAAAGSEDVSLRVFDRERAATLPETIEHIETVYAPPFWLADGRGFTYAQRQPPEQVTAETEGLAHTQARLHLLGTDPASDPFLLGSRAAGSPPFEPLDFPAVAISGGSRWAVGHVRHGDETDLTLHAAPVVDLGRADIAWRKVCDRTDQVTAFAVRGDDIFLLTAANAPRHKIVRTSLASPDIATAATVYAPDDVVVETLAIAADAIYAGVIDGAAHGVVRIPFAAGARPERLTLPGEEPSAAVVAACGGLPGVVLRTASWIRAGRILIYDPATGQCSDTGLVPVGESSHPGGLVAREVLVTSHDGVAVPLSIVHRADLVLDGSAPTLLIGYGAYGFTSPMGYAPQRLAWLERGGVYAVAHVRGGGAFGKPWHHAGRKATKPNTWKDFIACAEHLVAAGYTSPERLCGFGRSAGGILIGRAVTDRPDLFAAANIAVGCTDMLRFELTLNGPPNIPEFGTATKPDEFRGLLAMSTLHAIRDGVRYPGILFTHGINDPRVAPWQSAKTFARFREATAGPRPVLIRIDYHAGHGIGSTSRQVQEELADVWAFFLWQCGDPSFAPAQP